MKINLKLIFTVIFIQIIPTFALFNIWNEELQHLSFTILLVG